MPKERETKSVGPPLQDVRRVLKHEDLVVDATSMVQQALQFYLPGEVEVTVCLAFKGDNRAVAISTSVESADRMRWVLHRCLDNVKHMALRARGEKGKIIG